MSELLQIDGLRAAYGPSVILHDVSLSVAQGETLALLGRNGAGKSSLIKSIVGLTSRLSGDIRLCGRSIGALRPEQRAASGIGWVPQERNIFKSLTVEENITAVAVPGPWTLGRIYELFPRLAERKRNLGQQLSGGEQQMLAVGRALALNPKLLLLDEPLEGLAPIIAKELLMALRRIITEEKMAAILVEQNPRIVLPVVQRAVILERGRLVYTGRAEELSNEPGLIERYLAVGN